MTPTQWLDRFRDYLARPRVEQPAPPAGATARPAPPPPPPPPTSPMIWTQTLVAAIPLSMFVVGALLTAFSQLIGLWALLGYLLVALSPIVYALHQIENRLQELIDLHRQRRDE